MSAATAISVRAFHSPGVSPWSVPRGGIERILGTALPPAGLGPPSPLMKRRPFPRLDPSPSLPGRRCGCLQRRTPTRHLFTDPTPLDGRSDPTSVERDERIVAGLVDVAGMSMTPKPVRFSAWQWEVVGREAAANGLSTAEFVRAASIAAAVISARRRGAGDTIELEALLMRAINDRDDS